MSRKPKQTEGIRVKITIKAPIDRQYWVVTVVTASRMEYRCLRLTYQEALSAAADLAVRADDPNPEVLIV